MKLHRLKGWLLVINLVGGALVLGSYAWGFATRADAMSVLWGDVPGGLQPAYTANMLLAALGYIVFSVYILLQMDAGATRVFGQRGFGTFHALYAVILFPSALWMPLTFMAIDVRTALAAWVVRGLLAVIGVASLGMLAALWSAKPTDNRLGRGLALIGGVLFCMQTVVLDAIVWSVYFKPA